MERTLPKEGHRFGIHCHGLETPCRDDDLRDGAGQTRGVRSTGSHDPGGDMEGGGHGRADAETLHDAGELRVRLFRADDAEHGPAGTLRRDTACGGRLSAQPGRLLGLLRRRLAHAVQQDTPGGCLSHARFRSGLSVTGHSPRRPVGRVGIDGHQAGEPSGVPDQ